MPLLNHLPLETRRFIKHAMPALGLVHLILVHHHFLARDTIFIGMDGLRQHETCEAREMGLKLNQTVVQPHSHVATVN